MPNRSQLLIVDDEPTMCSSLADIFEEEGYHVRTAMDGDTAANLCRDEAFDLILLDVRMPALQKENFLSIRRRPFSRIVLMSAYGLDDLRQMARSEQALLHLPEPVTLKQIQELALHHRCTTPIILNVSYSKLPALLKEAEQLGIDCWQESTPQAVVERFQTRPQEVILFTGKLSAVTSQDGLWVAVQMPPSLAALLVSGFESDFRRTILSRQETSAIAFLRKPLDLDLLLELAAEVNRNRKDVLHMAPEN